MTVAVDASAQAPMQADRLDELVREYRRRVALTQQEVADLAGMSVAALRDLEQGRVTAPRPATLRGLATALQLSAAEADELLRRSQHGQRPAPSGLRLQVLGPLVVTVGGAAVDPGSGRARALLGLLALSANTPVGRDALIEVGWGTRPPPNVGELLQTHISRLRRRLAPPDAAGADAQAQLLVATGGGYQLTVTADELDLLAFRQAFAAARRAHAAGDLAAAAAAYQRATALWRGDPLEGETAARINPMVATLVREWQSVVVEYAATAEVLGRHEQVLPLLERLTAADPLHEAAHARLMLALAGSGQQAAALARFDELRRRLADELGADPGPELAAAHQRVLRQEVTRPSATPAAAHRQLPPDLPDFTGRVAELADLHERLPVGGSSGTAITITAIEGMAGVGKTRLAVHLAHQLLAAGRYADAQLYVDLRGHAAEPPADPATVLASFLHLLGVAGTQIPADLDARAALYRDRLHDRAALVLLDNAASEEQVRPLLPASPTNLVLVTSRRALAVDGAHELTLDLFTPAEAQALLTRIVGARRVAAEPEAAARVVALCGRLPLAVALAARRLSARPAWTLADLAARLAETGDRLGELTAGSRQLRAVFDLSYRALEPPTRHLFGQLGLHVGPDFTAESTAALAGVDLATARGRLDRLVDEHLVTVAGGDRYRLHDLLRDYAVTVAAAAEPEPDRRAAVHRLLDYYLHTAGAASKLMQPYQDGVELIGTPPAHGPRLGTAEDAVAWLEAERANLTAAVTFAADAGYPAHAWRLSHTLGHFLYQYGYPEDWGKTNQAGLAAARAAQDSDGEAAIRAYLGWAYLSQNRAEDALDHLYRALELQRQLGNRTRETNALINLGAACFRLARFAEALAHTQQAIELCAGQDPYREAALRGNAGMALSTLGRVEEGLDSYRHALELARQAGDRSFESGLLANLGDVYCQLGRYPEAVDHFEQAMAVATEAGLRPSEAGVKHGLGKTYREMGRLDEARAYLTDALHEVRSVGGALAAHEVLIDLAAAHRDAGDLDSAETALREALALAVETRERYQEARALDGLGHVQHRAGRTEQARTYWERARAVFTELGTPEADEIARRLAEEG